MNPSGATAAILSCVQLQVPMPKNGHGYLGAKLVNFSELTKQNAKIVGSFYCKRVSRQEKS